MRPAHGTDALTGVLSGLLLLTVATLALVKLDDTDTWWHLAAGRYILTQRSIPTHDVFSFTAGERPWIDLHWLFQIVLFGTYRLGGVPGITLLTAAGAVAAFAILNRLLRRTGPVCAALTLALVLLVADERFMVRPEIASLVLCATYLALLERYPNNGRWIWVIVPLQLLWVNTHALFVVGLLLLAAYATGRTAASLVRSHRGDGLTRLWVVTGVAAAVSVCNPYGLQGALLPLTLLTRISTQNALYSVIGEFHSPFDGVPTLSVRAYEALIAIGAASWLVRWRDLRLDRLLAWTAFLILSILARRNMGLFALVSAPLVADGVAGGAAWLGHRGWPLRSARTAVAIGLVVGCLILMFLAVSNRLYWGFGSRREFGLQASSIDFPVGAVDFLERGGVSGNLFNDLAAGGYLIWREYPPRRVFIDGRLEVYDQQFFARYLDVMQTPQHFAALAEEYDINAVLLFHVWRNRKPLVLQLAHDPAWALVHLDENAVVFVRDRPGNLQSLALGREELGQSLTRYARTRPDGGLETGSSSGLIWPVHAPHAHLQMGNLLLILDQPAAAQQEFAAALQLRPSFLEARVGLGYARWDAGYHDAARAEWQRVLAVDPHSAGALEAVRLTTGR